MILDKPYLLIPKLIEQPTWGGNYIIQKKHWSKKSQLHSLRIGQSYELYGNSKLSELTDSSDVHFEPELHLSSGDSTVSSMPSIPLKLLIQTNGQDVLGPKIENLHKKMPLLIKFTQALGNSFQLHIRVGAASSRWKAKPESWYYFEKGKITVGVQKQCNISQFQSVCSLIDNKMKKLSQLVQNKGTSLDDAQNEANKYIHKLNPWQFVQTLTVNPNTIVDLSSGGLQHSWEEDFLAIPNGNILYEVQIDQPDDESSIRCFDQGKIKEDGSIRKIHIKDYFSYLDTSEEKNDLTKLVKEKVSDRIIDTKYYTTDELDISKPTFDTTIDSFVHLFVRKGIVHIKTKAGSVRLTQGHSAFIPWKVGTYNLIPESHQAVVLKTYIYNN